MFELIFLNLHWISGKHAPTTVHEIQYTKSVLHFAALTCYSCGGPNQESCTKFERKEIFEKDCGDAKTCITSSDRNGGATATHKKYFSLKNLKAHFIFQSYIKGLAGQTVKRGAH